MHNGICDKALARFAHDAETWLSYGHSIPWYGGGEFSTLRLSDGTEAPFWSLVPLHPSEIEFKLEHGADALFEKLAAAGNSDLFDPARPPMV